MKIKKWHAFLFWVVGTLTAIALIGDAMYLGLGIALGSGVVFGLLNWLAARNASEAKSRREEQLPFDLKRNLK